MRADSAATGEVLAPHRAGSWSTVGRRRPTSRRWIGEECVWVNSLVDRIVSAPLEPAGAVAEPYSLWAVEDRPGLVMPCRHPSVVVTDDLKRYERLKLFILNLGHTYLAEIWAAERAARLDLTVREAVADTTMRAKLDALYAEDVLPVFAAIGMGDEAQRVPRRPSSSGSPIRFSITGCRKSSSITRPRSGAGSAALSISPRRMAGASSCRASRRRSPRTC